MLEQAENPNNVAEMIGLVAYGLQYGTGKPQLKITNVPSLISAVLRNLKCKCIVYSYLPAYCVLKHRSLLLCIPASDPAIQPSTIPTIIVAMVTPLYERM